MKEQFTKIFNKISRFVSNLFAPVLGKIGFYKEKRISIELNKAESFLKKKTIGKDSFEKRKSFFDNYNDINEGVNNVINYYKEKNYHNIKVDYIINRNRKLSSCSPRFLIRDGRTRGNKEQTEIPFVYNAVLWKVTRRRGHPHRLI